MATELSSLDLSGVFLHWPPQSVLDTDPFEFGINTGADRAGRRLNRYVPRDVDVEFDRALVVGTRTLVVVADYGSGAKRTVFEALRRNRPDSPLLVPRRPLPEDRETLFHVGIGTAYPGTILWLDDFAAFAGRSGSSLLGLGQPHATVVGLVRPGQRRRLDLKNVADLLEIHVPVPLSDAELRKAQALYPDRSIAAHMGFAFGEPVPAALSGSSRSAVGRAYQLARRRGDEGSVDATVLLLAVLDQAVEANLPGVTSAFVEFLTTRHPDHPDAKTLLARLRGAAGLTNPDKPIRPPGPAELTRPPLAQLLARAEELAGRATGSREAHLRHVLAAVVASDDPPLDPAVLGELGLTAAELRAGLRDAARDRLPEEAPEAWDELLVAGAPEQVGELGGGISADLVDPTKGIPLSQDHLNVGVYASMFASVIASKDTPMPLSIGVFGEWGSGKSYFMGLLREQVRVREQSGDSGGYLGDIVQIGFNAWHYADSNLWASLGDEIFRQLTAPPEQAEDKRARLREELTAKLAQRQELQATTTQAREETARLQAQLDAAAGTRNTRAVDLLNAMKGSEELRGQLDQMWEDLGVKTEVEQSRLLADQLRGVPDETAVLRRSLARPTTRIATITAAAVLALLAAAKVVLPALPSTSAWLGGLATLAALAATGLTVVSRAHSGLRQLRKLADDLQREAEAAAEERREREFANEIAALHQAEADERVAQAQLDEVVTRVGELGRELTDLAPGMRLYHFLADRAAGDAYSRYLGLISIIRKDFQELILLMTDWRRNPQDEPGRQPIDRIVLYIDDLDRCSPQQVVDVLQAVHLLLALDLFVVVVGVDPRWLLRSLRHQYRSILTTSGAGSRRGQATWETTPENYLQKIFNIPFALPGMDRGSLELLLRSLSASGSDDQHDQQKPEPTPGEDLPDGAGQTSPPEPVRPAGDERQGPLRPEAELPVEEGSEVAAAQQGTPRAAPRPLTDAELDLMGALEPLIDTPRDAKRLLNLYRILRSTRDLSNASRFLGDGGHPGDFQAVVLLLGMLTAHGRLLGQVLDAPPGGNPSVRGGLSYRPGNESWAAFVGGLQPRKDGSGWANDVAGSIPEADVAEWRQLAAGVEQASQRVTLPDLAAFQIWAPRIRRFSFTLSVKQ